MDKAIGTRSEGPLAGVVVADFSRVVAGPYCSMLLGDLGAEVIKVESPDGDDTRAIMPPARDGVGTYYLSLNRNKRSVVLDLTSDKDRTVAHALSARADVFLHNFKPGGLEPFELGYTAVRERNPTVVYCAISGFGTGAGAALPGYDLVVQAVSGLMSLTGEPDGRAMRAGIPVFDVMTGLHAAVGVLAALHHRDRTGEGQLIETDLLSSALSSMMNQTAAVVAGGVDPVRSGNTIMGVFPYEPMPTARGEILVIAINNRQFRTLCDALGAPALAEDPRFAKAGPRNANREALRPLLLDRLAARSAKQWHEVLSAAGLPSGPVNDVRAGLALAEDLGLQPVTMAADVPTVRNPLRMSVTPPRYDLAPPALDADGDDVRAWLAPNT